MSDYHNGVYVGPCTWHGIDNRDLATRLYDAFWAAYDQLEMDRAGRVTGGYRRQIGFARSQVPLAMVTRTAQSGYPMLLWQRMAQMLDETP